MGKQNSPTAQEEDHHTSDPGQPRAWQRMLSGRRLDLLDPSPNDIDIQDIAHGLARVARWNGQTLGKNALSVAQHVLTVERICYDRNPDWPNHFRRAALLHDAAEYVIGDLISPFKNAIGLNYKAFENRLLKTIHVRFRVPEDLPHAIAAEIKTADRIAAYFEATVLAGFSEDEAHRFFGKPTANDISENLITTLSALCPTPAVEIEREFLNAFHAVS